MRLLLALAVALAATVAVAQAPPPDEGEPWRQLALRAERMLEDAGTGEADLTELRAALAAERVKLLAARDTNAARIATLKKEIEALGPAPEDGADEPPEMARMRERLNEELDRVQAPGRAAQSAYTRVDGLIREIDVLLRERETRQLLTRGPTPLDPTQLTRGIEDIVELGKTLGEETAASLRTGDRRSTAAQRAPEIVILVGLALILLLRGRRGMERLTDLTHARAGEAAKGVLSLAVSLGQIVLPVLGLVLFVLALDRSQVLGPIGTELAASAILLVVCLSVARWLALQLFPSHVEGNGPVGLTRGDRREMRADIAAFGVIIWFVAFVDLLDTLDRLNLGSTRVLLFGAIVAASLILLRMGQLIMRRVGSGDVEGRTGTTPLAIARASARIMRVVGIVGPLAAALGYLPLGQRLVFATILSLALVGLIIVLHRLVRDAYILMTRSDSTQASEALAPVLLSFIVTAAGLPVLALIWGARVTDLLELWARIQQGITFGETRVSPSDFLLFALVFVIGYVLTRLLQAALRSSVLPRTRLDVGGRNAVAVGVGYLGIFLAAIVAITAAGINLSSLAIVAGALSVGIGFGLQNIVSNFVSGIILLIERPISEGDWIEVNGHVGYVRDISVRSTRIETFDRTDVIVPNADFVSGTVTNWTRGNLTGRAIVPVGVAYGTDTRRVERILREVAETHPMVALNPAPVILFQGFGASSLDFEIRVILRDVNWLLTVKSELNHEIAKRFAEEGIEIPFPQRDVWVRSVSTLHGRPEAAAPEPAAPVSAAGRAYVEEDDL